MLSLIIAVAAGAALGGFLYSQDITGVGWAVTDGVIAFFAVYLTLGLLILRKVKKIIGRHTKILGVVKADAYGHGMKDVSRAIVEEGVEYLGVASLDEARALRNAGIRGKIIVLGTILPGEAEGVLRFNVIQTVSELGTVRMLSRLGQANNRNIKVHIKIDTGMGRIGFWHDEAVDFVRKIAAMRNIVIDGMLHIFQAQTMIGFLRTGR